MDAISRNTEWGGRECCSERRGGLLCSSQFEQQYFAVLEAVQGEKITQARLDEAVLRVLNWKIQLGVL